MPREQYQIPRNSAPLGGGSSSAPAPRDYADESRDYANESGDGSVIFYTCGDCEERVPLEHGGRIRCDQCGARVLYKERTKRMVQFEAR